MTIRVTVHNEDRARAIRVVPYSNDERSTEVNHQLIPPGASVTFYVYSEHHLRIEEIGEEAPGVTAP